MHYFTLVEIPASSEDVDAEVAAALAPFQETEDNDAGLWDWY